MGCTLDRVNTASKLCHATSSSRSICPIHPYVNSDPDTYSSHINGNANTNAYSHTFIDVNAGTAWLSKAAGRLHTPREQRSNDQPTHPGDADPRAGIVWR